jgi:hypothetical protein
MLLGQFARVGQCVDRIEISGYQTFIERSKSRPAACITNSDQSSFFALHRAIFRHSARTISIVTPVQRDTILNGSDAEEGCFWREMIGVVSCLEVHNGFDIPNTIAIRFRTIR